MSILERIDPASALETTGYYVWRGLLDPDVDLRPLRDEYAAVVDGLASEWRTAGELSSTYEDLPFEQRLVDIAAESGQRFIQHLDISLPGARTTPETPIHLGPAMFGLLANPKLLDAVEAFIGPEVLLHPVQHARFKVPHELLTDDAMLANSMIGDTPWHQDQSVVHDDADDTDLLTVWMPMVEATQENGCIVLVPRSKDEGLLLHCLGTSKKNGLHMPDDVVPEGAIPVEMSPGDVLFMHRLTVHGALENQTNGLRWSLDLRYCPIGQPTGREWAPSFVVRSHAQPEAVVSDPAVWRDAWLATRDEIAMRAPTPFRWDPDDMRCA